MVAELEDVGTLLATEDGHLVDAKCGLYRLLDRIGSTIDLEALGALLSRSWFFRVWVVQEISIGRDVIFKWGEEAISYDHFRSAVFFCTMYQARIVLGIHASGKLAEPESMELHKRISLVDTKPANNMMRARRNSKRAMMESLSLHYSAKTHCLRVGRRY
jgi:hypothetical protein